MKRKALYLPENLHERLRIYAERENRTMVLTIKSWLDVFFSSKKMRDFIHTKEAEILAEILNDDQ